MDHIYIDSLGKKCVGEIENIEDFRYYTFMIEINKKNIRCRLDHEVNEWCLEFLSLEISKELAHTSDIFWNTEAINEIIDNIDISKRVAYAVKSVYELKNI
ncbi:MAG: hypothetical protein RR623_06705 [Bacilli bacterium]